MHADQMCFALWLWKHALQPPGCMITSYTQRLSVHPAVLLLCNSRSLSRHPECCDIKLGLILKLAQLGHAILIAEGQLLTGCMQG